VCGLAGFTNRRIFPDPGRLRDAAGCLRHRGPEDHCAYETPVASFSAARLKIPGVESAVQPLLSSDGATAVAFDGKVYNHPELRTDLERRGHRFRTRTAAETLLAAFVEWDTDCFTRLRGMFAVAFWTEAKRRLVLARSLASGSLCADQAHDLRGARRMPCTLL